MYHGTIKEREELHKVELLRNLKGGRPTNKFPVVCTSYEMVIRDSHLLSKINWEFIIIVRCRLGRELLTMLTSLCSRTRVIA